MNRWTWDRENEKELGPDCLCRDWRIVYRFEQVTSPSGIRLIGGLVRFLDRHRAGEAMGVDLVSSVVRILRNNEEVE